MFMLLKKLSTSRIIALGFALAILTGSILLMLPCSVRPGVHLEYIDSLYTSTSAVCVTGLVSVDAKDTFTPLGQFFLAMLIQIGGLGVTAIGAGIIIAMGKKVNMKGRSLIRDALNVDSGKGMIIFIRDIFMTTVFFELVGAMLSYIVFSKDYPPVEALGISLFHSIAAFNNSGFDILGNYRSLTGYYDNFTLNIITCVLIFFGGIGFLVIRELRIKHFHWKKLSMHSRVVISMSLFLIVSGTLLIKATENISWLGAFFLSFSTRTAGFSTYPLGNFSSAGLLVVIILMFIGASPGSTGGGIKTSTFFVLLQGIKSAATNKSEKAFHYAVPKNAFNVVEIGNRNIRYSFFTCKAAIITAIGAAIVLTGTYIMLVLQPELSFIDVFFEVTSAFSTSGLSTGITQQLGMGAKLLSIIIMYAGRLGPLTIVTVWYFSKGERVSYPEGNISVG